MSVTFRGRVFHSMAVVVLSGASVLMPGGAAAAKAPASIQASADVCFGKTSSALTDLIKACGVMVGANIKPDLKAAAYYNRGAAYLNLGNNAKAMPDFDAALKIMPDFARALQARGSIHLANGKLDAALKDIDRAIVLDPKSSVAFNNRALIQMRKGDHKAAVADFTKSIELDPKDASAHAARGGAFVALGEKAKALEDLGARSTWIPSSSWPLSIGACCLRPLVRRTRRGPISRLSSPLTPAMQWPRRSCRRWAIPDGEGDDA